MAANGDPAGVRALTSQLLVADEQEDSDPFGVRAPQPNRRRPRQHDEHTYRVRVDVVGAKPPIWRRLELSSHVLLDDLHVILQTSFGWWDYHLHRFSSGGGVWGDPDAETYLCSFDVDEGEEPGIPESEVRVDEVLVDPGDVLHYVYDYGDNWELSIRLEEVSSRAPSALPAICTTGRRSGPPEDSGGIAWFQQVLADAADPASSNHEEAVEAVQHYGGPEVVAPSAFDPDIVTDALRAALDPAVRAAFHAPALASLMLRLQGCPSYDELRGLVRDARLHEPVDITEADAEPMVRRYRWLLDRVGEDGIKLTAAGYLPPTHVQAAMGQLGMHEEWIGKGNREDLTIPVLELRESAQHLGLLRKYRGWLRLTKKGQRARTSSTDLWWELAGRLPLAKTDSAEHEAAVLTFIAVAAGRDPLKGDFPSLVARLLTELGWRVGDGVDVGAHVARSVMVDSTRHLRSVAALPRWWGDTQDPPVPAGREFARAVLTTT